MLFSYKVVEFFVDIIYKSTLGVYEKLLLRSMANWRSRSFSTGNSFCMCFDFQFYRVTDVYICIYLKKKMTI